MTAIEKLENKILTLLEEYQGNDKVKIKYESDYLSGNIKIKIKESE